MPTILKESDYYSLGPLLTRNAAWNFAIGARGLGKTFDAKRHCIRDFIKHGWEFIYLRRTDVEQKSKGTFFADMDEYFKNFTFRVNGDVGQILKDGDDPKKGWKTCCYFLALSQEGGKKSVVYNNVRTIIYDEVFPDNMQFLRGEKTLFQNFYNTVDRWKDKTRVIFLSNAVTQANPYFAAYHIDTTDQQNREQQFKTYCNGFICIELADYGGFSAKVAKSNFGQFILKYDPDFADYAISNKFLDDTDKLLDDMPSEAGYSCTLDTDYGIFGIWSSYSSDYTQRYIWVSRRIKRLDKHCYTLVYQHVDDDTIFVKKSDQVIQSLTYAYRTGRMRFDTKQVKADFSQVVGDLLGK